MFVSVDKKYILKFFVMNFLKIKNTLKFIKITFLNHLFSIIR